MSEGNICPAFLSVEDFARRFGISRTRTYQWMRDERIRSVRIEGRRRIPSSEIARLRADLLDDKIAAGYRPEGRDVNEIVAELRQRFIEDTV